MSPVTGMHYSLGSYETFQPSFRDEKRSKILVTRSGAKFGKKKQTWRDKNFNLLAYHSSGNS